MSSAISSCTLGNGGCQHLCIQLTVTQHRCQCQPQYQLQEDGRRCVRKYCGAGRVKGPEELEAVITWWVEGDLGCCGPEVQGW